MTRYRRSCSRYEPGLVAEVWRPDEQAMRRDLRLLDTRSARLLWGGARVRDA